MAVETEQNQLLDAEFLRKLEQLAILVKRAQLGVAHGERKSRRKGTSIEFADYRDYVQGDDLRHVDWNIYGRLNALYLKLFQDQEDLTVHLILDASKSMAFGKPAKIDFARKLAAAIGYIGLCGYDRVCCEALYGDASASMSAVRGKASVGKLFTFLGTLQADGETRLEPGIRSYALRNRARGVAVLFSDFFDAEGFEGPLRRLQMSGSECYAIHVLSRNEIEPEVAGDLKLFDCENNSFTEISVSPSLLKRYRQNLAGFTESIRKFCLARGITYVLAPSDTPFERLTLEVLRRGGMLR